MFCSQCGKADQVAGKYCRGCGTFLPDLSSPLSPGRYSLEAAFTKNAWMNIVLGVLMIVALPLGWWLFLKGALSKDAFMIWVATIWGGAFGGLLGNAVSYFFFRRRFQQAPSAKAEQPLVSSPVPTEYVSLPAATTNDLSRPEEAETRRLDPVPFERKIS